MIDNGHRRDFNDLGHRNSQLRGANRIGLRCPSYGSIHVLPDIPSVPQFRKGRIQAALERSVPAEKLRPCYMQAQPAQARFAFRMTSSVNFIYLPLKAILFCVHRHCPDMKKLLKRRFVFSSLNLRVEAMREAYLPFNYLLALVSFVQKCRKSWPSSEGCTFCGNLQFQPVPSHF